MTVDARSRSFRLSAAHAVLVVVLATIAAYGNSFGGLFVMDDISEIEMNPAMRTLLPPWRAMFVGRALPARPLPYLSFAIDHSVWGNDPFGYHLTNLVMHTSAALALFGLTRLTLLSKPLRGRFESRATLLAMVIAVIWAVHPLQTQAVTYVYQRIESLTGMLCLLSLFCFARAAAGAWDVRWLAGCILLSAAAMASKESAVVLPLLIASYDWLFSGEGTSGLRRRSRFYAGLAATWGILAAVFVSQAGRYGEFHIQAHRPLAYLLTQPRVILHYLRLAAFPNQLCFDYVWRTAETWPEFLSSLVYVLATLAVTAAGLFRRRCWAWLGVAFFLTLAPTSSFMPVAALAAEHRMYLPLAACVAAVVLGGDRLVERWGILHPAARRRLAVVAAVGACLWAIVLVSVTRARNEVYATPGGIWLDVLAKQPASTRALWNLAATCLEYDEFDAALRYADEATTMNPRMPVYHDLAVGRRTAGDLPTAIRILRHGLDRSREALPADDPVVVELAKTLQQYLDEQQSGAETTAKGIGPAG